MGRVARIGLLTLAFWGALLVCLSGTAAHADTGPTLPISHSGRWLTDAAGRVVIIHGVNIVEKRAPYSPDSHGFNPGVGKFIQSLGFNGARLGLLWAGVEPSAGVYDQQYVNQVHADADTLASDGVMSLVDFHQDLMNEQFGGEGFPTWAVQSDGLPAQPLTGFPLSYASSPGENAAWLNFYNNARDAEGIGLQDSYAKAWQFAAASFASDRSLIGYDLINEPWSLVTNAPLCVLGCAGFEHGTLAPFEARVMRSIRGSDPQHLLFYEPVVETQFGLGAYDMPNPDRDPEAAMSYHAYCLVSGGSCPGSERRAFENGLNDASANGDAGLLSEFGATNDLSLVQPLIADADAKMEGWMWWAPNLTGYFSDSYTDLAANDPQWP
ncbi:MAG: cellulase family glycosylhydrolase, partial [Solirubrobacterales bacterium]|nr:cellulase family glycosylhydrolase [Solirubrobacterales bacterium]